MHRLAIRVASTADTAAAVKCVPVRKAGQALGVRLVCFLSILTKNELVIFNHVLSFEAICALPCLNGGICSSPGKCTCPDDYQGSRCQKGNILRHLKVKDIELIFIYFNFPPAVCKPKCRRGGKCIGPGICLCRAGFAGSNCELRLSSSSGENKRRNRKKTNSVGKAKAIFLET
jgi:hypothetical protein